MSFVWRRNRVTRPNHRSRGAIILLFAALLVVTMALLALSLDLGYVCSVRTDLQAAVDAGALAGAGVMLDGKSKTVDTGKKFTEFNLNNQGVQTASEQTQIEVELGHWNTHSRKFSPGGKPRDAVKVTANVEKASLFFASAVGRNRFSAEASAVATYKPRDIMLVLDISGSMKESRNGIRKIDELREAVRFFLQYLRRVKGRDEVGFVYYSTKAQRGRGPSSHLDSLEDEINDKLRPEGFTNIADGMQIAREELANNGREIALPLMVLLTDGAANMNQPGSVFNREEAKHRVIEQAELAKQQEIPIFTMALDSLTTQVDVELMKRVADITGSEAFHIISGERDMNGNTQLLEAFRRVANDRPLRLVQ